jgi:hypothetical protein
MRRLRDEIGSQVHQFCVSGAGLCIPAAIVARAAIQDEHRQEENRRDDEHRNDEQRNRHVYDRAHKDYHNWENNEDRAYRQYYSEQHRDYRDYDKLNHLQQNEYWNWRHNHSNGEQPTKIDSSGECSPDCSFLPPRSVHTLEEEFFI